MLLTQCVQCHDLRTILVRPRMPSSWVQTVSRMADRSLLVDPIAERDQWVVSAYLIAISPQLQESAKQRREQQLATDAAREIAIEPAPETDEVAVAPDPAEAEQVFEATCSGCHEISDVAAAPPGSAEEARALVARMVENGLEAPPDDLERIVFHLTRTYAR